jgi:hypothetical protein
MIFLALLTSTLFELPKFWLALIWTGLDWTDPQRVTHIPKNHSTLTLKSPQAPVRFRRSMRLVLYGVQPGYIVCAVCLKHNTSPTLFETHNFPCMFLSNTTQNPNLLPLQATKELSNSPQPAKLPFSFM